MSFIAHEDVVWFAKSIGLFYLIAMACMACAYAVWPSRKATFERAARSILIHEDTP
ncbi:cbb3-type cytochrome c oxidase subunit 3 [Ancylobacter sp. A5.8]|nr:cbb3-type cytochrome c oxidase subunit 3 [Ancylobacter gelatini]MCJ8143303.1 cbb3-type cytochrome c oxidase subunit 3 [Ancylobacter gelatini]